LMDGQAISFPSNQHHPRQDAALAAGDAHSLSMSPLEKLRMLRRRNGHIYLCYQSIFKLQPLFDHVLADILIADYQGHVVLQASRHSNQTSVVATRLQTVLKERLCGTPSFECPAMTDAYSRVHFIGRVTSDTLINVLQQASVILHPFPFGGSKTAFDAINAAIPLVTYPQQYLRGRMATVFLRFLDLNEIDPDAGSCCIANSISDYVAKAIRLASDESYRTRVSKTFQERRTRIFDDKFIALEWGKLLTRALNIRVSEEAILSQIHFSRKSYQQDDYFAKKVEEEQMRWSRNAMLSSVTSPH
jgi:predicted O-linked N-acetylglucosamine transferase (SPINDLY family)